MSKFEYVPQEKMVKYRWDSSKKISLRVLVIPSKQAIVMLFGVMPSAINRA